MEDKNDAKLIRAYRKGDNQAFEQLLKRYERPLFSFIFRYVHDKQTAEDLFQQIWIKVLKALDSYDERGQFGSWLFGIANNNCIDHLRSKAVSSRDDVAGEAGFDQFSSEEPLPDEALIHDEKQRWLEAAIQELPEDLKEVLLLRLYSEMPFKEIAEKLNCPLNTVLGRMHYAVGHLKKMGKIAFGEI